MASAASRTNAGTHGHGGARTRDVARDDSARLRGFGLRPCIREGTRIGSRCRPLVRLRIGTRAFDGGVAAVGIQAPGVCVCAGIHDGALTYPSAGVRGDRPADAPERARRTVAGAGRPRVRRFPGVGRGHSEGVLGAVVPWRRVATESLAQAISLDFAEGADGTGRRAWRALHADAAERRTQRQRLHAAEGPRIVAGHRRVESQRAWAGTRLRSAPAADAAIEACTATH